MHSRASRYRSRARTRKHCLRCARGARSIRACAPIRSTTATSPYQGATSSGIAPGWGRSPRKQHTLAEIFSERGFRTGLISDLYHQFKPSKNFWRGFHQWSFIRGQEADAARSGPWPTQAEIDYWVPRELHDLRGKATGLEQPGYGARWFSSRILLNMRDRVREELWFNAQVMQESARWIEQNLDAERLFLTVESFDPHEPWFVPELLPPQEIRRGRRPGAGDLAVCRRCRGSTSSWCAAREGTMPAWWRCATAGSAT
jgi:arylsulfatase A-like enzyme